MKRVNRCVSEETKKKMSIAKQGAKNPMYGKSHSEVSKQRISKSLTEYWSNIPALPISQE